MNNNIDGDEFETIMDLIVIILFMSFAAAAITWTVHYMNNVETVLTHKDKITVTQETDDMLANPIDVYKMSGYQALMLAWVMDENGNVPVTWYATEDSNRTINISENMMSVPVYKTQVISGDDRSIKNVYQQNLEAGETMVSCMRDENFYKLKLSGEHLTNTHVKEDMGWTEISDTGGKDYIWTLSRAN